MKSGVLKIWHGIFLLFFCHTVIGVEEQDFVYIGITASKESVLVDEPFGITLSIMMKCLTGRYAGIDPLNPSDPPVLDVPYLGNEPIAGLESPNIKQLLRKYLVTRPSGPGFALNKYTIETDPFSGMFEFGSTRRTIKAKFRFDRRAVTKDGKPYFEYTFKVGYVPKEEGDYTFGPAVFKGNIITGVDQAGRGSGKSVLAIGPARTVRVVPPPEQDRPSSYIGVVGTGLVVRASLDEQTCNVGDPLTLTLAISGGFNLDSIYPPPLNEQAGLTRHFRIYEDTVRSSTKSGWKEYAYTIRPTTIGTLELPSIEVSYYDFNERAYKTVRTEPIPVRANETAELKLTNVLNTAANRIFFGDIADQDIFIVAPLGMNPAGSQPGRLTAGKWHIIFVFLAPLFFGLVITIRSIRKNAARNMETRRRRNALNRAITLLREAEKAAGHGPARARRMLCAALRKYLADRFGVSEAGLTPGDAVRLLESNKIDAHPAARFREILERNFNAEYTGGRCEDRNSTADYAEACEVLRKVDAGAK